jgi:hypothetical protein
MMRWLFGWAIRIGLGIVAFFISIWIVLLILNPNGALLLGAIILGQLFSNHHPPAIVDGVITSDDWGHRDVVGGN